MKRKSTINKQNRIVPVNYTSSVPLDWLNGHFVVVLMSCWQLAETTTEILTDSLHASYAHICTSTDINQQVYQPVFLLHETKATLIFTIARIHTHMDLVQSVIDYC